MTSTRPSRNSEARGHRNATTEHDRLKRALIEPVQSWVKKWTFPNNSKQIQIYKWVKVDKEPEFEDDSSEDDSYPVLASENETTTLSTKREKEDEETDNGSMKRQKLDVGGDTDIDTPRLDEMNTPQEDTPGSLTVTHASSVNTPDLTSVIDTPVDKPFDANSQSSAKTSSPVNTTSIENTDSQMDSPMEERVDSSVETPLESTYAPSADSPIDSALVSSSGNGIEKSNLGESFVSGQASETAELENNPDEFHIPGSVQTKSLSDSNNSPNSNPVIENSNEDQAIENSNEDQAIENSDIDTNMEDAFSKEARPQEDNSTPELPNTTIHEKSPLEPVLNSESNDMPSLEKNEQAPSVEASSKESASNRMNEPSENIDSGEKSSEAPENHLQPGDMDIDSSNVIKNEENESDAGRQSSVDNTELLPNEQPHNLENSESESKIEVQDDGLDIATEEAANESHESHLDLQPSKPSNDTEVEEKPTSLDVQSVHTDDPATQTAEAETLESNDQSVLHNLSTNENTQTVTPEINESNTQAETNQTVNNTTIIPEETTQKPAEEEVNPSPMTNVSGSITPASAVPVNTIEETSVAESDAKELEEPIEDIVPVEIKQDEDKQEKTSEEKQESALGALCGYSDDE